MTKSGTRLGGQHLHGATSITFCRIVSTLAKFGTTNAGIRESTQASCHETCGTRFKPN